MLNSFIAIIPAVVGCLYASVGVAYLIKGDVPWSIVWLSYALANVGLIMVGLRN